MPPSESGIARCAGPLDRALDLLGPRATVGLPVAAADTQRARMVVATLRRVRAERRRAEPDLVVVDLSGRALAEFFVACRVAVGRRRPRLWLVAHDTPELVGAPLLFSILDRRGGRQLGMALSETAGRALERWLARRADAVLALSELGAAALRDRHPEARVRAVPHPAELRADGARSPVVYCPAGVTAADLAPTLEAFASGQVPERMQLRVGHLSPTDRLEVERWARSTGMVARLELTGFLDQDGLDASFADAAVVVRHRASRRRPDNWAAASGPIVWALAAGAAVVSTDDRGSRRCVAAAGVDLADEPERLTAEIARLAGDDAAVTTLGDRAAAHVRDHHTPEVVALHLGSIWQRGPS